MNSQASGIPPWRKRTLTNRIALIAGISLLIIIVMTPCSCLVFALLPSAIASLPLREIPSVNYQTTHDIPNPWWAIYSARFSYTPEAGPPGPGILDTRPDVVLLRYIHDYIRAGELSLCSTDPYSVEADLDIESMLCKVKQPIKQISVILVTVYSIPAGGDSIGKTPLVDITFKVVDAEGKSTEQIYTARPYKSQSYWNAFLHEDCWGMGGNMQLYTSILHETPPKGLLLQTYPSLNFQCDGQQV